MFANALTLDSEEVHLINRAHVALRLHKLPHEIDAAPAEDIWDVLSAMIDEEQNKLEERKQTAQRGFVF